MIQSTKRGVLLAVRVVPNASRTGVEREGSSNNAELKIRLQAAPVDGEANKRLLELLSKLLVVPKSSMEIVRGATSRSKVVLIQSPPPLSSSTATAHFERLQHIIHGLTSSKEEEEE